VVVVYWKDDKRFSHLLLAHKTEGKKRARKEEIFFHFRIKQQWKREREREQRSSAKTKPKTILFILFHRSHCYEMMKALAACFVALLIHPKTIYLSLSHAMPPPSSTTASEFAFLVFLCQFSSRKWEMMKKEK
jgi:hypothetical protein